MVKGPYEFRAEDAERFAREQGIKSFRRGEELHFAKCPYCRERTTDKNTFAINLKTGQFKCLRATCGAKGNMITLAQDFGFSLGQIADEYFRPSRKYRDLTRAPLPTAADPAKEYLQSRGIQPAITDAYRITVQKEHQNIIVFPFIDDRGELQFVKYRKTDFDKSKDKNKEWCEANCKPILFGMDHCDPTAGPLVLTEGQIDSLSVAASGIPNAVSVPTGAKGFTWVSHCWDFLMKYDTLIVFGDHEKGEITLLEDMRRHFRHGRLMHVRPEDYKGCKDANELLQKYGKQAIVEAVQQAVPIRNERIKPLAEVEPKNIMDLEGITSGMLSLDQRIGKFFFGQLVLLTGERNHGKSTLGSQFIAEALNQGQTCFCYSGELPDFMFQEWLDVQLAGHNHINAKTEKNGYRHFLVNPEARNQIHEWYRPKMYIYDNSIIEDEGEESETLVETVKAAIVQYACRVILIDNLMTAMIDDTTSDLYRQQTVFVQKLVRMCRQYNVLIFLVAHPRKSTSGKDFQNDDISGSSNISNLADVILRYSKPKEEKDADREPDPADRILQITKERNQGRLCLDGIKTWFEESSKRIHDRRSDPDSGYYDYCDKNFGWEKIVDGFIPVDNMEQIPF